MSRFQQQPQNPDLVAVLPDTRDHRGCLQEFREAVRFAAAVPELQAPLTSLLWELAVKPALAPRLAAAAVAAALMPALLAHQVRQTELSMQRRCAWWLQLWRLLDRPPCQPIRSNKQSWVLVYGCNTFLCLGSCCDGGRSDARLVSSSG